MESGAGAAGKEEHGGRIPLPDWGSVVLDGRLVYIVFDKDPDPKTKRNVNQARVAFKTFLKSRRAQVNVIDLPANGDKKVGLDDFLKAGHTIQYIEREDGICLIKGPMEVVRLTNFTARILVDMRRDDGTESILIKALGYRLQENRVRPTSVPALRARRAQRIVADGLQGPISPC